MNIGTHYPNSLGHQLVNTSLDLESKFMLLGALVDQWTGMVDRWRECVVEIHGSQTRRKSRFTREDLFTTRIPLYSVRPKVTVVTDTKSASVTT